MKRRAFLRRMAAAAVAGMLGSRLVETVAVEPEPAEAISWFTVVGADGSVVLSERLSLHPTKWTPGVTERFCAMPVDIRQVSA